MRTARKWLAWSMVLVACFVVAGCSGTVGSSSNTTTPITTVPFSSTDASTVPRSSIVGTSTTVVPVTTTLLRERQMPSELVEMYEWDPEGGFHDTTLSGTLAMEVRCVYIDAMHDGDAAMMPQGTRMRSLLHLSEPRTRFDPDTGALWVNGNGPMYNGDRVTITGSEGWQREWNINNDDGTQEWGNPDLVWDPRGECSANTSHYVASMTPENTPDTNIPRNSELPGLGLFSWDPMIMSHDEGTWAGVIVIEPPCVYVKDYPEGSQPAAGRFFLSMPRHRVRYDPHTETLWNGIHGPFSSGDKIETVFDPVPNGDHEEFVANGCTATGNGAQAVYPHSEYQVLSMRHPGWPVIMSSSLRERIQPLQQLLASIREIESTRIAGWGINPGPPLHQGWVLLAGNKPPSLETTQITNANQDIQIRVGATHTHAELLTARQELFANIEPEGTLAEIEPIVTFTGIDMAANAVRIGIDPTLANPCEPTATDPTTSDEALHTKAAEVTKLLQEPLDIAFVVVDGRGFGDPTDYETHHCTTTSPTGA